MIELTRFFRGTQKASQYDVVTRSLLREMLTEHFSEPWLDAPDGPVWWWAKTGSNKEMAVYLKTDSRELYQESFSKKWQRVIPPSN